MRSQRCARRVAIRAHELPRRFADLACYPVVHPQPGGLRRGDAPSFRGFPRAEAIDPVGAVASKGPHEGGPYVPTRAVRVSRVLRTWVPPSGGARSGISGHHHALDMTSSVPPMAVSTLPTAQAMP